MNKKNGISLVILVITIIVMIILGSVVVYVSSDTFRDSKLVSLATDLVEIEDLIDEYYLSNDELPLLDSTSYTKTELLALINEGVDTLSNEISVNGDDSKLFYKVDLSKLPINDSSRGMQIEGDSDIYVIASDSLNLYYLKGEKISRKYYFSLTESLTKKTNVSSNNTDDTSTIDIFGSTAAIKLTKNTKDWTNVLTVKAATTLEADETLKYYIAGEEITSNVVDNTINVADILLANENLKSKFYDSEDNKILKVQKNKDEVVVTEATISVSNLDILGGNMISQSNIKHTKYSDFILATISGYSDLGGSGVKEARVVYTTKLDTNGDTVQYYDDLPTEITKEYVYSSGAINSYNMLNLPTDVTGYSLVFVDNAGTISDVGTFTVTY